MKKRGFTLAEVLISLGVVGVIGAVTVPSLINLRPDERKATVLKTHKIISETIQDILDDPSLYVDACLDKESYIACDENTTHPDYSQGPSSSGNWMVYDYYKNKGRLLSRILSERLDTRSGQQWTYNTIENGVANITLTDATAVFQYNDGEPTITLEFPKKSHEQNLLCNFGQKNCQNPRRFIFDIDSNGKVTGQDALTRAYLLNPHKLNDAKKDLEVAQKIWDEENPPEEE